MGRCIGRMSNRWSHGARVSVTGVRESLELHSLAGVHFFAESKEMEGGIRADLILHTCKKGSPRVDTAVIGLIKLIYLLYKTIGSRIL